MKALSDQPWSELKVGKSGSHSPIFSLAHLPSRGSADDSFAPHIQIPPFHQRGNLAVCYRTFQHPKAAIRVYVSHTTRSEHFFRALNGAGYFLRRLDVVHLDVHHAQPDADVPVHVLERGEGGGRAMGEFEHEMVGVQTVEKRNQRGPVTLL